MGADVGLLILRVTTSLMMLLGHGWGKLLNFGKYSKMFPDPIGMGSSLSLGLAVFAEVGCAVAIAIGFRTRWSAVPMVITMLVAGFLVHGGDPWSKKELAFLYAAAFLPLVFTGGGKYSLDAMAGRR